MARWDIWNNTVVIPITDYIDSLNIETIGPDTLDTIVEMIPQGSLRAFFSANRKHMKNISVTSICAFIRFMPIALKRVPIVFRATPDEDCVWHVGMRWHGDGTKVTVIFDSLSGGRFYVKNDDGVTINSVIKLTQYLSNSHKIEKLLGFL